MMRAQKSIRIAVMTVGIGGSIRQCCRKGNKNRKKKVPFFSQKSPRVSFPLFDSGHLANILGALPLWVRMVCPEG